MLNASDRQTTTRFICESQAAPACNRVFLEAYTRQTKAHLRQHSALHLALLLRIITLGHPCENWLRASAMMAEVRQCLDQNPSQTTEHLKTEIKREDFLWRLGLLLQRQTYDAGCAWPFLQRYHSNTASEGGLRKLDYLFYQVTNGIVKRSKMDTLSLMSQWRRWTRRLKGRVELNIRACQTGTNEFQGRAGRLMYDKRTVVP
jgi:hypothetical protein